MSSEKRKKNNRQDKQQDVVMSNTSNIRLLQEDEVESPIHIVMYFHNDTRVFGEWMGTNLDEKSDFRKSSVLHTKHNGLFTFFKEKCVGDNNVTNFNRITTHPKEDGRICMSIESPMNWYQSVELDLHKKTVWRCSSNMFFYCTTYWKEKKLIVRMSLDDEEPYLSQKMQIREVCKDNPNKMMLTVKWDDKFFQKQYHRVVYSELLFREVNELTADKDHSEFSKQHGSSESNDSKYKY